MKRLRDEAGQMLVLLAGAAAVLALFVGVLGALGRALGKRAGTHRA